MANPAVASRADAVVVQALYHAWQTGHTLTVQQVADAVRADADGTPGSGVHRVTHTAVTRALTDLAAAGISRRVDHRWTLASALWTH